MSENQDPNASAKGAQMMTAASLRSMTVMSHPDRSDRVYLKIQAHEGVDNYFVVRLPDLDAVAAQLRDAVLRRTRPLERPESDEHAAETAAAFDTAERVVADWVAVGAPMETLSIAFGLSIAKAHAAMNGRDAAVALAECTASIVRASPHEPVNSDVRWVDWPEVGPLN
jgi:hypothetical protein